MLKEYTLAQISTQQRNHLNVNFFHTLFDIVIWLKHYAAAVVDAATWKSYVPSMRKKRQYFALSSHLSGRSVEHCFECDLVSDGGMWGQNFKPYM